MKQPDDRRQLFVLGPQGKLSCEDGEAEILGPRQPKKGVEDRQASRVHFRLDTAVVGW